MSSLLKPISITSSFCGGNILHILTTSINPTSPSEASLKVTLNVEDDPYTALEKTNHKQWFYFKSTPTSPHLKTQPLTVQYSITNANETAFPSAWPGSTVCVSIDNRQTFTRLQNTVYSSQTGELSWEYTHTGNEQGVYFSYFEPYDYHKHLTFIDKCAGSISSSSNSTNNFIIPIGQTIQGREMTLLKLGSGPKKAWVIARQHPGETQASFYAEGLISRLLGLDTHGSVDGTVAQSLKDYTWYIVPNMNPDGSANGYLRTNAAGANLNREWQDTVSEDYKAPTLERSPEVKCVLEKMDEIGVDVFCDVHGDEAMPFNFIAGSEGCSTWSPRMQCLQGIFLNVYCNNSNSDMQSKYSYTPDEPGQSNNAVCSNQIAVRYDCLSVTLEMPYKDCLSNPDPERGFTGARCSMLGKSLVEAFASVAGLCRSESEFWKEEGQAELYVRPVEEWEKDF